MRRSSLDEELLSPVFGKDAESNHRTRWFADVIVPGIGLMQDYYDLAVINLARPLLSAQYGDLSATTEALVTASALVGSVVGMLVFGAGADWIGRRRLFMLCAILTGVGSAASAAVYGRAASVYRQLVFWRFVMGLGIGGEYPLSAAHSAEHVSGRGSGLRVTMVYATMGLGSLLSPGLCALLLRIGLDGSVVWRALFGCGAFFSVLSFCARFGLIEDAPKFQAAKRRREASGDSPFRLLFFSEFASLIASTSVSWFLYDVVSYGLALYSAEITPALGVGSSPLSRALGVLALRALNLPGYVVAPFLPDLIGRRATLVCGFLGMAALLVVLALLPERGAGGSSAALMLVLFGLQGVADAGGPGAATYLIPGEVFPSALRASAHGTSAAMGKVGASVGAFVIPILVDALGMRRVFALCAAASAFAALLGQITLPNYDAETLDVLEDTYAAAGAAGVMSLLWRDRSAASASAQRRRSLLSSLDDATDRF
mmetsp:Transcript_8894/g.29266  ORF Transcript_8894/g.29266 Transcript_8894/m.29266 type:complete len:487 (+) Transcript_8894:82-1542(+)